MNQNKRVAVCIPFYNLESYVNRCLDSVLGNTYQNLEVICVNDGSTDRTSKLLHKYAEKDSRVIVIEKEKWRSCIFQKSSNGRDYRRIHFVCRRG